MINEQTPDLASSGFRVAKWPKRPAPVFGKGVVEYLTRKDLVARGWSRKLIDQYLVEPDGTRSIARRRWYGPQWGWDIERRTCRFYLRDRVLRLELLNEVRAELALGSDCQRASADCRRLALTRPQLRKRGWAPDFVTKFLPVADAYYTPRWSEEDEPLFDASRVEEVEASQTFQHLYGLATQRRETAEAARNAQLAAQKAAQAVEEAFCDHRAAVKKSALARAFPGFVVTVNWSCSGAVNIAIALEGGPMASVYVKEPDAHALAERGEASGDWGELLSWLVAHTQVGNQKFRMALGYLAAGDPDGWREFGRRCKERQLEVARSIAELPEAERFAAWRNQTGLGPKALSDRLAELDGVGTHSEPRA